MSKTVAWWVIVHSAINIIAHSGVADYLSQLPPPFESILGASHIGILVEITLFHYLASAVTLPLSQAISLPGLGIGKKIALFITTTIISLGGILLGTSGFFVMFAIVATLSFAGPTTFILGDDFSLIIFELLVGGVFIIRAGLPVFFTSIIQAYFVGLVSEQIPSWVKVQQTANLISAVGIIALTSICLELGQLLPKPIFDYALGSIFVLFLGPVTGWILGRYWARNPEISISEQPGKRFGIQIPD